MGSRTGSSSDVDEEHLFDPAKPFKGIVVCCTNIPPELRSDIAAKTAELGGIHRHDLTPDCTHLIVGEYDTPKYRHVAKERPDVKPMAAAWVEAVRDLWVEDADIDFAALENEWQLRVFEAGSGFTAEDDGAPPVPERPSLLCCMTGFDDPDVREEIANTIRANGGLYTGDLSRRVTHLVVHKPEGRKYLAAKNWGIQTVSIEWVNDSVARGMILDEKYYDPVLPQDKRGVGAWNKKSAKLLSRGKRLREGTATTQDEGRRKLRKTASMKLNSQRDHLWGDILGKPQSADSMLPAAAPEASDSFAAQSAASGAGKSMDTQGTRLSSFGAPDERLLFASCCFYVHGFSAQKTDILVNTVASLGGLVCHSLDEATSASGAQLSHRFLIVPQASAPETHPLIPDNVHIITEFYIERCLHKKYFFDPSSHTIGRPFPAFPISGFENLTICTAGFTGVDLNQADKAIRQLGAKYEERFNADVSVLICTSLSSVRKQKLDMALAWKLPVVSADWLWQCISTGYNVPIDQFLFPELRQKLDSQKPGPDKTTTKSKENDKTNRNPDEPTVESFAKDPPQHPTAKPKYRGLDFSAFATTLKGAFKRSEKAQPALTERGLSLVQQESNATTHFDTARTHQLETGTNDPTTKNLPSAPLSEASSNVLNKASTSQTPTASQSGGDKQHPQSQQPRKPLSRIASEIADSEADENEADTEPEPEPESEEAKFARLAEEAAALKAAERLAIASKLANTLLDSTALPKATSAPSAAATTTSITTTTEATTTAIVPADNDGTKPKRRKREILGRAVSNVSAASSASADSVGNLGLADLRAGGFKKATTIAGGADLEALSAGRNHDAEGESITPLPASTQIDYEDPDAKHYKAQLMRKMMTTTTAAAGKGKGASFSGGASFKAAEKLTLGELGGYDLPQHGGGGGGGGGGGQRERRSRRK
ncbi:BRCT domain-containing protein [Podospora appendiculata]|uniref:BRCT domain-containing protein n=1 Tax=Podospora appendiculata TaxID=314037 RepID=A0AAE1C747_9PEZI|nr:BRCT domain-containing protein [Podospora appendiculata]